MGQEGSSISEGISGIIRTGKSFASLSSTNQNNPWYNVCNYHYASVQYLNTNLECYICGKKGHIHRTYFKKSQLSRQQSQNSTLSYLFMKKIQTNIVATIIEEFAIIEEAPASNIFLEIIYTTVLKLLAAMSTLVSILDLGATRHISDIRLDF